MKIKNKFFVILSVMLLIGVLAFITSFSPKDNQNDGSSTGKPVDNVDESEQLTISFLGDSISTYSGWSNNSFYNSTLTQNVTCYPMASSDRNDIRGVSDTYWAQVIEELNLRLCVNNSCDASRVSDTRTDNIPCGMVRASELHRTSYTPDIIVVYIGTNDIANGISLEVFTESYRTMVNAINESYPRAEVYLCTLLPERRYSDDALLCSFNDAIKSIAAESSCTVVDFYTDSSITWDNYTSYTIDNLHPNAAGMDKLTECIVNTIKKANK